MDKIQLAKCNMKKIDNLILVLFSVFVFFASILCICVLSGWINLDTIFDFIELALANKKVVNIIFAVAIVLLICSVKGIFFSSTSETDKKKGVLMQNDNGKLLISKATIENIVHSVVRSFDNVEDVIVSADFDDLNNLIINVNLVVEKSVIIKELTVNLQNKIKDTIKRTSDLEVKEVNVRIKDVSKEENQKNH